MSRPISTAVDARPRPVLFYGMFTAAVTAFLGFAGISDLMPKVVIAWVALVYAVIGAAWAVYVQSITTPVSSPRAVDGTELVPKPEAVPPGASTRTHDVHDR